MKAYIDKSALVAEIEKELNTTKKYSTEYVNGKKYALKKILSFLDTLEAKDVEEEPVSNDLEEAYTKRDVDDAWLKGMCDAKRELEKQKDTNVFDVPKISIKDAIEVTSRMQYIEDDMKPIAEFIMDYANWDLHKDEWNQPTLTVPLFRVLDALIQRGKPYCECSQNIEKQGEQKPIIEMKSAEESLGIDSETYNKIVDECIYGEQKSTWSEEKQKL